MIDVMPVGAVCPVLVTSRLTIALEGYWACGDDFFRSIPEPLWFLDSQQPCFRACLLAGYNYWSVPYPALS